jgi:hypothetical protein
MPGTPGLRLTGAAPHASDASAARRCATPYDSAYSLPMTSGTVGGPTYGQVVTISQEGTR